MSIGDDLNKFNSTSGIDTAKWDNNLSYDWYKEWWQPTVERYYYPSNTITYHTIQREDTFKKAFAIAKLLLKKNLLVSRRLPEFISLVEMIAEEL